MTTAIKRLAFVSLAIAAVLAPPNASAAHSARMSASEVRLAAEIGPDQAAAIVRELTGGRVLGVRAVQRNGRVVYRVKVLKDGYVRIYHVDGSSGNVLG